MKFTYYPGCSLKGTGRAYEESLFPVFKALGVELNELDDWNCCGATAYMSVSESAAFTLSARNLAKAEKLKDQILAPCSACYMVLKKTQQYVKDYPQVGGEVRSALKGINMEISGDVKVRHPLDVLVNDIGLEKLAPLIKKPLKGLKVAPYYGCQIVRPYATFDHQAYPVTMDKVLQALGAEVVDYPLKTWCCGGSMTGTISEVGLRLCYTLLKEARRRGADVIVVLCPLCQFNLDAYQDKVAKRYEDVTIPVVYFTQLMGLAMGFSWKEMGLQRCIVSAEKALAKIEKTPPVPA